MAIGRDHLIGTESVEQTFEDRQELRRFGAIRPRLVVVAGQQQRDRHAADGVVDHRSIGRSTLFIPSGSPGRHAHRYGGALPRQMFLDRVGDGAFETSRGEDVARVSRVGQPLHDGPQALRDTGNRIADAVVVDQEKTHG
jgi:hypothetical protein